MERKQKQTHPEVGEDATQYGEWVSTYFAWIPLPEQKKKAEELAKMTKVTQKENRPQIEKKQKENRPQIEKKQKDTKLNVGGEK